MSLINNNVLVIEFQIRYLSSLSKSKYRKSFKMKRRMFLKSSLLMTSGLGFDTYVREEVREERVQVKKPHVILIMTDQHRGDALGCMGNSAVISPNLDRLAKEGTLFVNG